MGAAGYFGQQCRHLFRLKKECGHSCPRCTVWTGKVFNRKHGVIGWVSKNQHGRKGFPLLFLKRKPAAGIEAEALRRICGADGKRDATAEWCNPHTGAKSRVPTARAFVFEPHASGIAKQ